MPKDISNTVPIINTCFSLALFVIAIINLVVKKDEEKLKKYQSQIVIFVLIGLTASVQLYFTYFAKDKVNKTSSTLLIFNIITGMWLISLINDKKCTPTNCKLYDEQKDIEAKEPFYKNTHNISVIITSLLVIVSGILIYMNNKQKVDEVASESFVHVMNATKKAYESAKTVANKAYEKIHQPK